MAESDLVLSEVVWDCVAMERGAGTEPEEVHKQKLARLEGDYQYDCGLVLVDLAEDLGKERNRGKV